jgi:hypothetical protein
MANVDECVRNCEQALCVNNMKNNILAIYNLNENNKVNILKNKEPNEIRNFLQKCKLNIKSSIALRFYKNVLDFESIILKPTSNNNKNGADLFHKLPNGKIIQIEVKFGSETTANIGIARFEKIFGSKIFSETLSIKQREQWKQYYIQENGNQQLQTKRLFGTLNVAIEKFNKYVNSIGNELSIKQQFYLENEIINNSGNEKHFDYYMKFSFKNNNPEEIQSIITGLGVWKISIVDELPLDSNSRVHVVCQNPFTNTSVKFVLNWKNDEKNVGPYANVSAKLGLGSPNWNVWVKVEILES